MQRGILFVIHFDAFLVLYLTTGNVQMIGFYLMQLVLLVMMIGSYHLLYQQASELVLNNMCMLLAIGFIILTRLSFESISPVYFRMCRNVYRTVDSVSASQYVTFSQTDMDLCNT